jgi:hypothetical protein
MSEITPEHRGRYCLEPTISTWDRITGPGVDDLLVDPTHSDKTLRAFASAYAAGFKDAATERDDLREKCETLTKAAHMLLAVVCYPDNGHHYCRYCNAGTNNGWQHAEGCSYTNRINRIDEAREFARAALSPRKEGE